MSFDLPTVEAQLRPSLDTLRHHVHNLQSELGHGSKAHEDPLQIMLRMLDRIDLMLSDPRKYHELITKNAYPYTDIVFNLQWLKLNSFMIAARGWFR